MFSVKRIKWLYLLAYLLTYLLEMRPEFCMNVFQLWQFTFVCGVGHQMRKVKRMNHLRVRVFFTVQTYFQGWLSSRFYTLKLVYDQNFHFLLMPSEILEQLHWTYGDPKVCFLHEQSLSLTSWFHPTYHGLYTRNSGIPTDTRLIQSYQGALTP